MRKAFVTFAVVSLSVALSARCISAPPPPDDGFTSLFNGKNLDGWQMQAHALWTVENNAIVGRQDPAEKTDAWLFTQAQWSDFSLELDFKVTEHCNSGIALRMPADAVGDPDMHGYEVQICDVPGKKQTGSLLHHIDSKAGTAHKPNQWNHLAITCQGDHITIILNGQTVVDTKVKGPPTGRIGMQIAKGKEYADQVASFQNIRLKNLAPPAPTTAP